MAIVVQTPGGAPDVSTCTPWASLDDLGVGPCADYTFSTDLLSDVLQASSDILFQLTGRQFAGSCQDTVRPCARSMNQDMGRPVHSGAFGPYGLYGNAGYSGGGWYLGSGSPWGWCSCQSSDPRRLGLNSVPEVSLGVFPVTSIVQVKIDGQPLSPNSYRVDDDRYLVRLSDPISHLNDGWPCCQDLTLPDTEKNTWSVTMTYGVPPPVGGKLACAELACQLAMAFNPDTVGKCRLPQRVTQVTRQGITAVVLDPMAFLDKGKTGLYAVDLFISSVNPTGLRRRASVINPDVPRRVRRTQ